MYRQENQLPSDLLQEFQDLEEIWQLQKDILSRFKNVKIAFIILDNTNQGYLSLHDFSKRLTSKGFPDCKEKYENFFRYLDQNKDDKISLDDWNYGFQSISQRLSAIKDVIVQHTEMLSQLSPKQESQKYSHTVRSTESQRFQSNYENKESVKHFSGNASTRSTNPILVQTDRSLALSVRQGPMSPKMPFLGVTEGSEEQTEESDSEYITRINFFEHKRKKSNPAASKSISDKQNFIPYDSKGLQPVANPVKYRNKENSSRSQTFEEGDLYKSQTQFDTKELQEARSATSLQSSINNWKTVEHPRPASLSPVVEKYQPLKLVGSPTLAPRPKPEEVKLIIEQERKRLKSKLEQKNKENDLKNVQKDSLKELRPLSGTSSSLNIVSSQENKVPKEDDSKIDAIDDKLNIGLRSSPFSKPLPLKEREVPDFNAQSNIEVWTARQLDYVSNSPIKEDEIVKKSHVSPNKEILNNKEDNSQAPDIETGHQVIYKIQNAVFNQTSNVISPERKIDPAQNLIAENPIVTSNNDEMSSFSHQQPFRSLSDKLDEILSRKNIPKMAATHDETTLKSDILKHPLNEKVSIKEVGVREDFLQENYKKKTDKPTSPEISPVKLKEVDPEFLYDLPNRLMKGLKSKFKTGQALLENVYSVADSHSQSQGPQKTTLTVEESEMQGEKKQENTQEIISESLSPFKIIYPLSKITPIKTCKSSSPDNHLQCRSIDLGGSPNVQINLLNPSEIKPRHTTQSTPGINIEDFESYKDETSREYSLDVTSGWETRADMYKAAGEKFPKTMPKIAEIEEDDLPIYTPSESQDKKSLNEKQKGEQKELSSLGSSVVSNKTLSKDSLTSKNYSELDRNQKIEENKNKDRKGQEVLNLNKNMVYTEKDMGKKYQEKIEDEKNIPSIAQDFPEMYNINEKTETKDLQPKSKEKLPAHSSGVVHNSPVMLQPSEPEYKKPSIFQESLLKTLKSNKECEKWNEKMGGVENSVTSSSTDKPSLFQRSLQDIFGAKSIDKADANANTVSSQKLTTQASKIECDTTISKNSIVTDTELESKKPELSNEKEVIGTNRKDSALRRMEEMLAKMHKSGKVDLNNPTNLPLKSKELDIPVQQQSKTLNAEVSEKLSQQKYDGNPKTSDQGQANVVVFSEQMLNKLETLLEQYQSKGNQSHKLFELAQAIGTNKPDFVTTQKPYLLEDAMDNNISLTESNHICDEINYQKTLPKQSKMIQEEKQVEIYPINKETGNRRNSIQDNKSIDNLKVSTKTSFLGEKKQAKIETIKASPVSSEIINLAPRLITPKSYLDKNFNTPVNKDMSSQRDFLVSSLIRDKSRKIEFSEMVDSPKQQQAQYKLQIGVGTETRSKEDEIKEALILGLGSFNLNARKEREQKPSVLEKLNRGKSRQDILNEDMRGAGKAYLLSELARLEAVDRQLVKVSKSLRDCASEPKATEKRNK